MLTHRYCNLHHGEEVVCSLSQSFLDILCIRISRHRESGGCSQSCVCEGYFFFRIGLKCGILANPHPRSQILVANELDAGSYLRCLQTVMKDLFLISLVNISNYGHSLTLESLGVRHRQDH